MSDSMGAYAAEDREREYLAQKAEVTPPRNRLERAKATLRAAHDELAAAEQEAAAAAQPVPPPLPDELVAQVKHLGQWSRDATFNKAEVLEWMAMSHGVSVEALREAIK